MAAKKTKKQHTPNTIKGIDDRRLMFAIEYMQDRNGTQAAIRAGYAKSSAHQVSKKLLECPNIRDYIQKETEKRSEKLHLDADYVLKSLKDIAEKAKHREQWSAALKALELLGKHLKLFTDVMESTTTVVQMPAVTIETDGVVEEFEFKVGSEPDKNEGKIIIN